MFFNCNCFRHFTLLSLSRLHTPVKRQYGVQKSWERVTSPETGAEDFSEITDAEAKHEPLVYRVEEIAQLLAISPRAAYNLCNTTKDFQVLRIGASSGSGW